MKVFFGVLGAIWLICLLGWGFVWLETAVIQPRYGEIGASAVAVLICSVVVAGLSALSAKVYR